MLKFFLLFLVSFSAYGQGDLSGNLRSQYNNTRLNFGNLQVPNNQATKTGAINALIETGNKNILSNPGFEHTLASTGWTITGTATTSTETAAPLAGLKSFRADMSAQTFNLKQTTTIYAAARAGSQMFARIQIKNTAPNCTMYIVKNSVRQTGANDQLAISTDGVTRTYELAFLANGTSNGFEVDCTSTTGVIITDEGELSTESAAFVDVAQIGPWIDYGPITITATTTNPTKATTRQQDSVRCRISGQDYECEYRYRADSNAGASAGSGGYLFSLPSGISFDASQPTVTSWTTTAAVTEAQASNPATYSASIGTARVAANLVGYSANRGFAFATSSTTFQALVFNAFTNAGFISSGYAPLSENNVSYNFSIKFRGTGLSNKVTTYSQACTTDVQCENVFSAKVSAAGVVSDENLDWINGNCSNPSTGTYECPSLTSLFSIAPNIQVNAYPSTNYCRFSSYSAPTVTIFCSTISASPAAVNSAFTISAQKQGADFKAKNVITGTFKDVVTSPNAGSVALCSAKISSTGVISDQIGGCFASCTNATTPVCTFTSNYWVSGSVPNCKVQPVAAASAGPITTTATTVVGEILNASNAAISGNRQMDCHGLRP